MKVNRALIADDHVIVREGLKSIIKDICPFMQVDEAINGGQVFDFVKRSDYDILVLDVNMPDTDAITLITNILAYKEESRILVFSMNEEHLYAKRFFKLGVLGYLDKESGAEEIRKALETVLTDKLYMSENLRRGYLDDMVAAHQENPFQSLSNRELQIAKYLLKGYSSTQIKDTLNLHSSTVGTHKIRTFEKLKIRNVFELRELANLYQLDLSKI
ncbi:MAG TPA: response regulator transcription factor [Puia sp.]|uniref:response regulator transcription factor n=1 Tax=Puia sp. TaxID=2045100 RepID=UPI002C4815FD|nr:response regulator transcription factor [Puia sp.]HVU96393.1 response regulator transcription factor [Puia sp.]